MAKDWNKEGYFSGVTEDYSNYRWYKGENECPYTNDAEHPLAATFWRYERDFHFDYLSAGGNNSETLSGAYKSWKDGLLNDYLPGKSPNPYGDTTDWGKAFETGENN